MEFLYRHATPAYKGSHAQPTKPTGVLSGLGSVLGGGATPAYKTRDELSARAPMSTRSWLRMFEVTPSYKTAPPRPADPTDPCAEAPDDGADGAATACGCDEPMTQIVIV
jgi:hypothetical protein